MGKDKAMLPVEGSTMALMLAEKYKAMGPVAFSVDRAGRFPTGGYRELVDRYPGCGPLNGLVSAFLDTEEEIVFLTATDMPGGDVTAVKELLERLGEHDACLYEGEPLFGVYRRSCLPVAQRCLEEGQYALRRFLQKLNVHILPVKQKDVVRNLNTPEEYAAFLNQQRDR